jgi:hypothetical protein
MTDDATVKPETRIAAANASGRVELLLQLLDLGSVSSWHATVELARDNTSFADWEKSRDSSSSAGIALCIQHLS